MKLSLQRFMIMEKRILRQPFIYIIAGVLIMLSLIYRLVPPEEKSASIPVAVLCMDGSEEAVGMLEDISNINSVFNFYSVADEDEMYSAIISGKADSGFIIPEDYLSKSTSVFTQQDIRVITTEGSVFPSLAADLLYSVTFKYSAYRILEKTVQDEDIYSELTSENGKLTMEELMELMHDTYANYISSDSIFHLEDISGGKYSDIKDYSPIDIPIRKIGGFFIFAASLLGAATYLVDKDMGLFLKMDVKERLFMRLADILTITVPVSVITYFSILICYPEETGTRFLLHITVYMIISSAFAFIISLIIRKSTLMKGVLPVYLVLTIIFGGIFFDLSSFSDSLKLISSLFIPYYF